MINFEDLFDSIKNMTNEEINHIIHECTIETDKRQKQKEDEAINNFKKAFFDLEKAGIDLHVLSEDDDYNIYELIPTWDDFKFN